MYNFYILLQAVTFLLECIYLKYFRNASQPTFTCSKSRMKKKIKAICEICSKLTIKTPERGHRRSYGVFFVNFKHISHIVSGISILYFEQRNELTYSSPLPMQRKANVQFFCITFQCLRNIFDTF